MAYLGLARKWRPQTFDDLVGQPHIVRTISNAIRTARVGHGYLFTGTRGIGKTTAARIFAKALRCQKPVEPGVPCGQCNDCVEISEGRSVDVLEIDGASNNGVDAVREIRENAKYLPASGKHKIYIIDEVHMLTTAAFNALLKTLEEPPPHVIFVFATTDPQKIPATVLSRCQRFDFKRVSQKDLTQRLQKICAAEKVAITPDALAILAREAEGSMRDAISLLDQILACSDAKVTVDTVTEALGLIDKRTVLDCVAAILKRKPLQAVEAVGKVHLHGFDLKLFGREILRCLRQLMVTRLLEENAQGPGAVSLYMDVSDVDVEDLKDLQHERSLDDLDMLFRLLNHGLEDVARSAIPKMVMDVLVMKMASSAELVNLSDIGSLGGAGPGVGRSSTAVEGAAGAPSGGQRSAQAPLVAPLASASSAATHAAAAILAATMGGAGTGRATSSATSPATTGATTGRATSSSSTDPATTGATTGRATSSSSTDPATTGATTGRATSSSATGPATSSATDATGLATSNSAAISTPQSPQEWLRIVAAIRDQRPLLGSILEHMSFEGLGEKNGVVTLTLGHTRDHSFYRDQLQTPAYNELLGQLLKKILGRAARLEYKEVLSNRSIEELERESKKQLEQERRRAVMESDAFKATQQLLGAKLESLEVQQ